MRVFWAGGAQPDRADDSGDGHRALMAAAHHGHVNTVRALLEGGADPTLRTTDGLTARQIADASRLAALNKQVAGLNPKKRKKGLGAGQEKVAEILQEAEATHDRDL